MVEPVGSMLGYQILIKGEAHHPGQLRAWELPSGLAAVTEDPEVVLERRLTPFTLDSIVRLAGHATAAQLWRNEEFAQAVSAAGEDPRLIFSPFLMRRFVREAILRRALPDQAHREMLPSDLKAAEDAVWQSFSPEDLAVAKTRGADGWPLFLRMLQAQYPDQLAYSRYKFETALALDTIEQAQAADLDLGEVYRSAYGCTFEDISFISATLSAVAGFAGKVVFDPAETDLGVKGISGDTLRAYWRHCAITYEKFAQEADAPGVSVEGYDTYALSPTVKWPLVILSDGMMVPPIAGDLLNRGARGFVIDSLQAIRNKEDLGRFNLARGRAFERYVGDTLSAMDGVGTVCHADDMFKSGTRHCDWICREGKNVTLIETKSIWFSLGSDMTKTRAQLKTEIAKEGSIADAVEQLESSARAIRDQETELPKNANLMGLIVVSGHQVGLNAPLFYELVDEVHHERGLPKRIIKYQIANDEGFTKLARRFRHGGSLSKYLSAKWQSPDRKHDDLHFAADVLPEDLPPHPLADQHDQQFMDMLASYDKDLEQHLLQMRALRSDSDS